MENRTDLLLGIVSRFADINARFFRQEGELPAALVIAPSKTGFEVLPLENVTAPQIQAAIRDAFLTITCLEGCIIAQNPGDALPDTENAADHPDARRCYIYLAQARDGTRACAVQYILKPEHGRATLAPLKVLQDCSIAIMDSDLADLTRPGTATRGTLQ